MTNRESLDAGDEWDEEAAGEGGSQQLLPPDIAPLERFVAPAGLDGSNGTHRCGAACRIDANDDRAAIEWWITKTSIRQGSAVCRRAMADKLLNWACFVRGKAVSSLDEEDFVAFARFLANPQPLHRWVGARVPRTSAKWRPFTQSQMGSSRDATLRHLVVLTHWLSKQRYAELRFVYGKKDMDMGLATVAVQGTTRTRRPMDMLTSDEWHWIRRALDLNFPAEDLAPHRLIVELLYYGNLYTEEVARLTIQDLEPPNRMASDWSAHIDKRVVWRGGETLICPPPLSDTISRWVRRLESPRTEYVVPRSCNSPETLLALDANSASRYGRRVVQMAASLAMERGDTKSAMRLRERSLMALRNAFDAHRSGREINQEAIDLTGRNIQFGLGMSFRMPKPGDWRSAEHLWTEGDVSGRRAEERGIPIWPLVELSTSWV
ncbi:hypothetical protein G8A07_14350 [Roseateles sp. DAIF2]|uniref:hypothetical protein n=1 Tax=Roseateles sp. DAIF2 TaxID=2714952 RepID=UPI0018A31615|nr:hypothetical protein [Roseateles sp. DAIF2]QPF73979.1 hypothetical protein G8A07_14350 [Roseateles sp. DAIF2]